jgi:hypothetical protein
LAAQEPDALVTKSIRQRFSHIAITDPHVRGWHIGILGVEKPAHPSTEMLLAEDGPQWH